MSDHSMDDRSFGGAERDSAALHVGATDDAPHDACDVVASRRDPVLSHAEADALLRRLDAVTAILRGWIWETDAEHRFTFMSESVTRFSGHSPEWHYGKTRQQLGNLCPNNAEHQKFIRQLEMHEMFGPADFVR
jgi:PAS domain-containing protein